MDLHILCSPRMRQVRQRRRAYERVFYTLLGDPSGYAALSVYCSSKQVSTMKAFLPVLRRVIELM